MGYRYAAKTEPLTVGRLKELWHYDPSTGIFTRIKKSGYRGNVGDVAQAPPSNQYVSIRIDNRLYAAHRLSFFYMTGAWPIHDVDHINGDKMDNRWSNLRDIPHAINMQNMRKAKGNNKSGYLGVHWNGLLGKWRAQIKRPHEKTTHIGLYDSAHEAHLAYVDAKRKLHSGCSL